MKSGYSQFVITIHVEYNQDTRSPAGVGIRPKPCENTRKWDQDTFDVYVSRRAPGYMSEIHAGFIRIHAGYSQDTLLTKQRQDTPGSRARCIEDTHTIYGQDTCSPAPLGIRSTSIRIRAGYAQDTPQIRDECCILACASAYAYLRGLPLVSCAH